MFANNQWMRLSVVLLLALIARMALGAEQDTSVSASAPSPAVAKPVLREELEPAPLQISFMPGFSIVGDSSSQNGWSSFSGGLNILTPLPTKVPLLVGLELGVDLGQTNLNQDMSALRALATILFKTSVAGSPSLHPYVGVAIGPQYVVANQVTPGFGTVTEDKRVFLEAILRVGLSIDVSKDVSLGLEPRAGLTGGSLIFNPLAFANISL